MNIFLHLEICQSASFGKNWSLNYRTSQKQWAYSIFVLRLFLNNVYLKFPPKTVFRINYRYEWQKDIINNPAERAATWYMGFSSYF
ncbi:MAG: hypothetical protein WBA61_04745 [Aequorivita sp.]